SIGQGASNTPNIKIEGQAVDFRFEQNENGISIYINANPAAQTIIEPAFVPVGANMPMAENGGKTESKTEANPDFPWYQIAVVGILLGIFICLFRKKATA
ncbi:MAG: hypothetical protein FWG06_02200, partial [Clostridiales bacterium]|nr:hypothetical protein [Clostridiales bacterium]